MRTTKTLSLHLMNLALYALVPPAYAITTSDETNGSFIEEAAPVFQQILSPIQRRTEFGLNTIDLGQSLFGLKQQDLAPKELLLTLSGELPENCMAGEAVTHQLKSQVLSQFVPIVCHGFAVDNIGLWLRFWQDKLTSTKLRSANLEEIDASGLERVITESELIAMHDFSGSVSGASPVWRWIDSRWTLTYQLTTQSDDGLKQIHLLDAISGELLSSTPLGFQISAKAQVLARNDGSEELIEVELLNLLDTNFLDGEAFKVFAPHDYSPRVQSTDGIFDVLPAKTTEFEQVQTYHNLTVALNWLKTRLGFDMSGVLIKVRTHALIGGLDPNNAEYVPPGAGSGPEIHLGIGSNKIRNLSRDSDVATHEFMHHLVYQFIPTRDLASAVALHEGFSDYFTYAITGDPYLAETALPNKAYLRTAILDPERRYDNPYVERYPHTLGEIWSAMLWQSREKLGTNFDRIVYRSLQYLDKTSDFEDALLALFNADRDLNPKTSQDGKMSLYGESQCHLIQSAIDRGFVEFIRNVDGSACGIDIETEVAQNQNRSFEAPVNNHVHSETQGERLFGVRCAVISGPQSSILSATSMLAFLFPLLVGWMVPHRRRRLSRT
jgi:hypothetical protein